MKSMPNLTVIDQQRVQSFAEQAAVWFRLFDCFNPSIVGYPPQLKLADRLEIIDVLYRMHDFRLYVQPFLRDDARITAFENAVSDAIYCAALTTPPVGV